MPFRFYMLSFILSYFILFYFTLFHIDFYIHYYVNVYTFMSMSVFLPSGGFNKLFIYLKCLRASFDLINRSLMKRITSLFVVPTTIPGLSRWVFRYWLHTQNYCISWDAYGAISKHAHYFLAIYTRRFRTYARGDFSIHTVIHLCTKIRNNESISTQLSTQQRFF